MSTFRIVYVPGMKPKPVPDTHRAALLRALLAGLERVKPGAARLLRQHTDRFDLVSWTFLFYGSYRNFEIDRPGLDRLLAQPEPTAEDLKEIGSASRRMLRWWHLFGDSVPWLSRLIASADMRVVLAEVRRYLRNDDAIADDVRALVKERLTRAWQAGETVMLIGHSLGSVIAYETLWELSRRDAADGRVDLLVTLGSPLATRFVRRSLRGADQRGALRYPSNVRCWMNVSAKGELTALHPKLRPFFGGIVQPGMAESLEDLTGIYNAFHADFGLNVHKSYGYLAHPDVADVIGAWLERFE
jgi:pimeloyl-ACP methyl ester carboxylesterase